MVWLCEGREKEPKSECWNDVVKAEVERNEVAWKQRMRLRNKDAWEFIKRKRVKRGIYQIKKEINEQFGRKMSQDVSRNGKMF